MKRVRLLSLLLCLVLLAGLIPVTARAEDEGTLYVNGVAVTQENAGDILGNGVFSYVEREERIGPDSVIRSYADVTVTGFAGLTLRSEEGNCIEIRNEKRRRPE
ncbi:MAG: hypothetical protein IJR65_05400 [Oscillospiraceae bacterium]|nr:hypothetical protein [Oscillospiraceae bacterium]